MPIDPIPVLSFLVPEHSRIAPDGFTRVDEAITRGLPHAITLANVVRVSVTLPTGLARAWRDGDPGDVVSSSEGERAPWTPAPLTPSADVRRAPLRLVLSVGGTAIASVPVVAGRRYVLPDWGDATLGVRVELEVLGWDLRAGSVRGAGDYGSRVSLAWRLANVAPAEFPPPPINADLARRLEQGGAWQPQQAKR